MIQFLILAPGLVSVAVIGALVYRKILRARFNRKFAEACLRDETEKAWRYWHAGREL